MPPRLSDFHPPRLPAGRVWLCAAVLGAVPAMLQAQVVEPVSLPVLDIKPMAVVSMPTETGKVYQMQVSSDLAAWTDSGAPVVGTGEPVEKAVPFTGPRFFRLQILDQPAVGTAPWTLDGSALQLNEGNRVVHYTFSGNGGGSWQAPSGTRPFTWSWARQDFEAGRVELNFTDGGKERLKLHFHAAMAGRFSRETYASGRLVDTDDGSFGPVPVTGTPSIPTTPVSIVGRSLVLGDQPSGSSLTLTSATGGHRQLDGQASSFSGQWLVTGGSTARLIAHFSSTHGEEYSFAFTAPLTGRYTRRTYTGGVFRDEDTGTFCLTNPP